MIPSVVCDVSNLFSIIANLIYDQNIGLSYFHAQGCSGWGTHLHKNIHTIGKVNFLQFTESKLDYSYGKILNCQNKPRNY